MDTAAVWSAHVRGFRLARSVEGLRPHTVGNYVGPVNASPESWGTRRRGSSGLRDIRSYTAAREGRVSAKTVHETLALAAMALGCPAPNPDSSSIDWNRN